ncbi:calcium and integrin-binding family member 2-like isoform X2 [Acropora millepora]|uniref:calcium and integrin-binding family member 2-like isoform X2 n=1 Tax=Acropora millepora TaxID=45264 RepID=UPI001CF1993C|nr:calcium and integrin-binding family member 2-like isoform X2 [Acropora millepora]
MGNKQAAFTENQLEDYQDCTYFNRADILRIHKRYRDLNPEVIPKDFTGLEVQPKLKYKFLQQLPELKAPRELKAKYAFRIFDFDGDDYIGKEDLRLTVRAITANELTDEETEFVTDKLLEEADLDESGFLSFAEFENVIARSPEFMNNFHIHI